MLVELGVGWAGDSGTEWVGRLDADWNWTPLSVIGVEWDGVRCSHIYCLVATLSLPGSLPIYH